MIASTTRFAGYGIWKVACQADSFPIAFPLYVKPHRKLYRRNNHIRVPSFILTGVPFHPIEIACLLALAKRLEQLAVLVKNWAVAVVNKSCRLFRASTRARSRHARKCRTGELVKITLKVRSETRAQMFEASLILTSGWSA
jgi:hypothetical protein